MEKTGKICRSVRVVFIFIVLVSMNVPVYADPFSVTFSETPDHAVLFIIDGLSYKALDRADLPVLKKMAERGTLVEKNYLPTAAHPSSGAYAELHSGSIPNPILMAGTVFITKDTGYLQDSFFPEKTTAFVTNSLAYRTLAGNYHYVYQHSGSDADAVRMALKFMEEGKPSFMRIHLQDTGGAGSRSMVTEEDEPWRWNIWAENSPYRETVARADSLVGEFLAGLDNLGVLEKTVVIVMGDHGQHDTGWHPPEFIESAITSIVLWGSGIRKGVRLPYSEQIDVTPTVCKLMNVDPPETSRGRVIVEALKDFSGTAPPRKELIKELLGQFVEYRKKMTDAMYTVERMSSGKRGLLFTRLSRGVSENFYDIERFSAWPRFDSLDELVENNRQVLENLDTIAKEIESLK